ncbi:cyclin-J isoform X2 [Chaetodon auriga]|uniref:cyclin-J isoform X2 n=1 Tax=Chaetodon auriga TaxID=39042 RepID=UPI004032C726
MELEDQWWKGQLAADIYQSLRYKELKLPSYKGQSPQLNLRQYFADLIAIVSNHFRLCPAARHLAVYLLDLFMDRYDLTVQQLHMVSLSCLLLASKFEEREDRVPKLETLNSLGCMSSMNLVLTKQVLLDMELLLLETFQWNLYLPTAAHFIEYCLSIAVHEGDLRDGWPMTSLEKTKLYMAKYVDYFLEVSLQVHMTVMLKRPASRSVSSLSNSSSSNSSSSSSRARQCTTVQARQPLWPSTCTSPACSIPSTLRNQAWPLTTGQPPTSATPPPACRLLTAPSTETPRASLLHWIQSPTFPAGLTKSACTTPAPLRALTDEGFSGCSHFWGVRDVMCFLLNIAIH